MGWSSEEVVAARQSLREEMAGADLGDARLNARRSQVLEALERHPDRSFPEACATDAETEALYRFLRNRRVTCERVIEPHVQATVERCRACGDVVVIHDTTENDFAGEKGRAGLAIVGPRRQAFWLHAALAVSADDLRAPLGLLSLDTWVRRRDRRRTTKPHWRERFFDPRKESRRWAKGVATVRERLGRGIRPIHLMDREGDSYELLGELIEHQERFVIRLNYDRRLSRDANDDAPETVLAARPDEPLCECEVSVAARPVGRRPRPLVARRPARAQRTASIRVAAATVLLKQPRDHRGGTPRSLRTNVVYAWEVDAPAGEVPLEWRLVTTEPIDDVAQVRQIIDWYRTRWLIEEFFKCLKTGCAYEKRQLESLQTLLVALGLLAPIAWQLLLMRHLTRDLPDTPATVVLTTQQLAILRSAPGGESLSRAPGMRDAFLVVARLGGHLKQNGEPGWLVLTRGMQKLRDMEAGWAACARCTK
jgi:hypothetical protein